MRVSAVRGHALQAALRFARRSRSILELDGSLSPSTVADFKRLCESEPADL